MQEVPLDEVDDNPFNSRLIYDDSRIKSLADSLQRSGQLSPIMLRSNGERYQIVYGHRRVRAARLLGWNLIRAEVRSFSDEEMLEWSVVENLKREDISDYEMAVAMKRMHEQFGRTYAQIGEALGYSQEHVGNFIRMTRLFDETTLASDSGMREGVNRISEHHARILLQLDGEEARRRALSLVVSEKLSVRDLERIVHRFRSWFYTNGENSSITYNGRKDGFELVTQREGCNRVGRDDTRDIRAVVERICRVKREEDFYQYLHLYAFDDGFTFYDDFPPFRRLERRSAIRRKEDWFYLISPKIVTRIIGMRIQLRGMVAVVTLSVEYRDKSKEASIHSRATIVLERFDEGWKVVHEHWSQAEFETKLKPAEPGLVV